jgi:hemerythrin-like domain-containing protein
MHDSVALDRPDTSDMQSVHRVFREAFSVAPQLIGAVSVDDSARVELVAAYYANVLAFLHVHHEGEDEILWPRLLERCPADAALVQHASGQHQAILGDLATAEERLAEWRSDPTIDRGASLAAALVTLGANLGAHLDDEERLILPLVEQHLTVEEWHQLPAHGMQHFTGDRIWLVLGLLREQMTPGQRAGMDAGMPPPAREFWVDQGEAMFTAFVAELRH